jgi:hypothetical protein
MTADRGLTDRAGRVERPTIPVGATICLSTCTRRADWGGYYSTFSFQRFRRTLPYDAATAVDIEDAFEPFPGMILGRERSALRLIARVIKAWKGNVPLTRNALKRACFRPISHRAHGIMSPGRSFWLQKTCPHTMKQ